MSNHHKINYIEIPASAMEASKSFFNTVFDWQFVDYGPDYAGFLNAGRKFRLFATNCDQGVAGRFQRAVFNAKYRFKNGGCFRLAYQILKLPSSNCMTE